MHQFQILGVPVEFPYDYMYPSQKALIANSLRAFQNQENALLESPTGTGKALALLSSSLAYQKYVVDNQIRIETDNFSASNDSFSFFSNSSNTNTPESSQQSSTVNIEAPRIWFTSRTHQQLKQLINEFKRLPYNPPMAILGGRKKLCLNKSVLKSDDISSECRKAMSNNKCPYKMESKIPKEFRPGGINDKFDIEDMLAYGKKHFRCPYHMSLVILSKADIVFCPYNFILDPQIKEMLELSVSRSIVIIDEAHNVENVCRESGSFHLTEKDFIVTLKSLSDMKCRIDSDDPDIPFLVAVTELTQLIHNWFLENLNLLKFIKKNESIKTVSTVFQEWNLSAKNWPFYKFALEKIITKKMNAKSNTTTTTTNEEEEEDDDVNNNNNNDDDDVNNNNNNDDDDDDNDGGGSGGGEGEDKSEPLYLNLMLLQRLFIFFVLAFQNNMDNFNKFQIALLVSGPQDTSEDNIFISCLDPSIIFKCISNEAHSIVLASGTLSPLLTFSSELGTKFPIQLSANHIIDKDQVESFLITQGIDGTPFISNHQSMQQNKEAVYKSLGQVFLTLLPEIPGGILMFMPSYKMLRDLVYTWKQSEIWRKINNIKKIFLEEAQTIGSTYKKYLRAIDKKHGGFLIGVCHGNMCEGMDFKDEQARAVFIFGIPYHNCTDIEVRLKKNYNDQLVGKHSSNSSQSSQSSSQVSDSFSFSLASPSSSQSEQSSFSLGSQNSPSMRINKNLECRPISGFEWYEAQAFRAVFQAIGRLIRHKTDYGAIFLIDQRFQSFASKFPRWVQSSFINHSGIDDIKEKLKDFYQNMQIRYPQKVLFTRGKQIMFECSNCKQAVVDITSVDFDQSEPTERKGFLELVEAGNDRNCIFLSRNSKIRLFVDPDLSNNIWSQEDLSVYNLIKCPKCNQKLGVHILATTLDDSLHMEGYLFLLTTLAIHEESSSTSTSKSKNKPFEKQKKYFKGKKKQDLVPEKGQLKLFF